jgi:hypothetical protein
VHSIDNTHIPFVQLSREFFHYAFFIYKKKKKRKEKEKRSEHEKK